MDGKIQQSEFVEAAMAGNLEYVKNYINTGGKINAVNDMGITALAGASQIGQTEIVKFLLQQKDETFLESRNERSRKS